MNLQELQIYLATLESFFVESFIKVSADIRIALNYETLTCMIKDTLILEKVQKQTTKFILRDYHRDSGVDLEILGRDFLTTASGLLISQLSLMITISFYHASIDLEVLWTINKKIEIKGFLGTPETP